MTNDYIPQFFCRPKDGMTPRRLAALSHSSSKWPFTSPPRSHPFHQPILPLLRLRKVSWSHHGLQCCVPEGQGRTGPPPLSVPPSSPPSWFSVPDFLISLALPMIHPHADRTRRSAPGSAGNVTTPAMKCLWTRRNSRYACFAVPSSFFFFCDEWMDKMDG